VEYVMLKSLIAATVVYGSLCFGAAGAPERTAEAIELAPNVDAKIFGEWLTTPPYPKLTQWLIEKYVTIQVPPEL